MRRTDGMWLIGGFLAAVLLVAAGWFLLISPKFAQADDVRTEADGASLQLMKLNKEVATLAALEKKKSTYVAQLRAKQAALPTSYDVPAFVRQLQDSGTALNVDISGITVGSPAKSGTVSDVVELPITLAAQGTPANLSRFLTKLQTGQPRAVLISSVNLNIPSTDQASTTASIALSAFCLHTTGGTCTAGA
nr:type 4a pilus biogenesis protein PilO [uncultured Actinoplanes sp.]